MGQHFVPQEFLRHFACPGEPDLIWAYDKKSGVFKKLPIKSVAQASDFYSPDDEQMLNNRIEIPAQEPMNRLRRGELLSSEEREAVSVYLASLLFRSPRTMRKRLGFVRDDPRDVVKRGLTAFGYSLSDDELDEITENLTTDGTDIRDPIVRTQRIPREIAACINDMKWAVFKMSAPRLVVADHPLYFNERQGVRSPTDGIGIPLAHDTALLAIWSDPLGGTEFVEDSSSNAVRLTRVAKAMNRRMVFQADRFLFCREPVPWLPRVSKNPLWNRRQVAKLPTV